MNLPTYSLTDSPNSTILNGKPLNEQEEEEEEWSDAEYLFPALQAGKVQVVHLPKFGEPSSQPRSRTKSDEKRRQPPYPSTSIIVAHTTPLASLAITPCGKLIATASVTGTLLGSGTLKLRPSFRPDGNAICASSDKGTIHLWNFDQKSSSIHLTMMMGNREGKRETARARSYLGYLDNTDRSSFPGDSGVGSESGSNASYNYRPKSIEDDVSLLTWIIAPSSTASTSLEPQIAVITRSGAWFRLRIPAPSDPHPLLKKAGLNSTPLMILN
ncbi:hypothetical protein PSHT_00878 [Puccinia striiformis]|uniref:Uncharacterized protein n=1 Tax=Puccinia striiformis TaxID=27350 RepID=A0A2S4WLM3_9BASI|nr:hypothetical protein PSHT_00878 [Puccinia striiformis]